MSSGVNYKLFLDTLQTANRPASAQTKMPQTEDEKKVTDDEIVEAVKQQAMTYLEIMRRFGLDFDTARPILDALQKSNRIKLKSEQNGRERFEAVS